MRACGVAHVFTFILIGFLPLLGHHANQSASQNECARASRLEIYSNAVYVEEAGDVIGYELAFEKHSSKSIKAQLYIYEGAPNLDGINLSGKFSGGKVTMEGNWIQHLIEEPSKKEITETQPVKVSGMLDSSRFRGTIQVSAHAEQVKMKRTDHIWLCKR